MPYYDNFWHKDAHKNIPLPACLIFFVKLKLENQLMRVCFNACFKAKGKHFEHML